jgi:N-acetylglucosaminyldiphosphoundecaprenol N-acetyl-beta-D-mannosaminyltransferase
VVARLSSQVTLTRNRVELLGTPVDRIQLEEIDNWIIDMIGSGEPHQVITANLDFIAIARRRPSFAEVIKSADLVLCDGKPLQWAAKMQGVPIPSRVTGMDLVLQTAKLSAAGYGYRIFLLGAAPGIAERAKARLEEFFPGLEVAGCYTPPHREFTPEDNVEMIAKIHAAGTDALFVALGAPRQDEWIYEHFEELDVPLCAGIGGVFNFLAGTIRRAPDWMQHAGLEWAFRLAQEPQRLWKRYLINDMPILLELLARQATTRLARNPLRPRLFPPLDVPAATSNGENDLDLA